MKSKFSKILAFILAVVIFSLGILPTTDNKLMEFNIVYAAKDDEEKPDKAGFIEHIITGIFLAGGLGTYAIVCVLAQDAISFDHLLFNGYKNTRLSFFDDITSVGIDKNVEVSGDKMPTSAANEFLNEGTRNAMNTAFDFFRNLAIIAYLIMMVFMGVRILFSVGARTKAKYNDLFMYWIQGVLILFLFPYVMKYTILLNDGFVNFIYENKARLETVWGMTGNKIPETSNIGNSIGAETDSVEAAMIDKGKTGETDYMTKMFYDAATQGWLVYGICYTVMVKQLLGLFIIYIKRFITVMFLITIFPLVTISYAIDKIGDGKSQAFNKWYKEFVLNVFLQSFHAIIYVIGMALIFQIGEITKAAGGTPNDNWILIVIIITFISKGDEMLRNIFHVEGGSGEKPPSIGKTLMQTKAITSFASGARKKISDNFGANGKITQGVGRINAGLGGKMIALNDTLDAQDRLAQIFSSESSPLADISPDMGALPISDSATSESVPEETPSESIDYAAEAEAANSTDVTDDRRNEALDNLNNMKDNNPEEWDKFKENYLASHTQEEFESLETMMMARKAMVAYQKPGEINVNLDEQLDLMINIMNKGKKSLIDEKTGKPIPDSREINRYNKAYDMLTKAGITKEKLEEDKARLQKYKGGTFKRPSQSKKTKRYTQANNKNKKGGSRYGDEIHHAGSLDEDDSTSGNITKKKGKKSGKQKQTVRPKTYEEYSFWDKYSPGTIFRTAKRGVRRTVMSRVVKVEDKINNVRSLAYARRDRAYRAVKNAPRTLINYGLDIYAYGKYKGKRYAFNRAVRPFVNGANRVKTGAIDTYNATKNGVSRAYNTTKNGIVGTYKVIGRGVRSIPSRVQSIKIATEKAVKAIPNKKLELEVKLYMNYQRVVERADKFVLSTKKAIVNTPSNVVKAVKKGGKSALDAARKTPERVGRKIREAKEAAGIKYDELKLSTKKRVGEFVQGAKETARTTRDAVVAAPGKAMKAVSGGGKALIEAARSIPGKASERTERLKTDIQTNLQIREGNSRNAKLVIEKRKIASQLRRQAIGKDREENLRKAERLESEANALENRIISARRLNIIGKRDPDGMRQAANVLEEQVLGPVSLRDPSRPPILTPEKQAKLDQAKKLRQDADTLESRFAEIPKLDIRGRKNPNEMRVHSRAQAKIEKGMREFTINETRQINKRIKQIDAELTAARKAKDTELINQKVEELHAIHETQVALVASMNETRKRLKENNIFLSLSGTKHNEDRIDENYAIIGRKVDRSMTRVDRILDSVAEESAVRSKSLVRQLSIKLDMERRGLAERTAEREADIAKLRQRLETEARIHGGILDDRQIISGMVDTTTQRYGDVIGPNSGSNAGELFRDGLRMVATMAYPDKPAVRLDQKFYNELDQIDPALSERFMGRLGDSIIEMAPQAQDKTIITGIRTEYEPHRNEQYNPASGEVPIIVARDIYGNTNTTNRANTIELANESDLKFYQDMLNGLDEFTRIMNRPNGGGIPRSEVIDRTNPEMGDGLNPETIGKPTPESNGKPALESDGKPTPESDGKPAPESDGKPEHGSDGKPEPESDGKPESESDDKQDKSEENENEAKKKNQNDSEDDEESTGDSSERELPTHLAMALAAAIAIINGAMEGRYTIEEALKALDNIKLIEASLGSTFSKEYKQFENLMSNLNYNLNDFEATARIQVLNDPSLISDTGNLRDQIIEESKRYVANNISRDDILLTMLDYDVDALREAYSDSALVHAAEVAVEEARELTVQDMLRQATAEIAAAKADSKISNVGIYTGISKTASGVLDMSSYAIGGFVGATIAAGMSGGDLETTLSGSAIVSKVAEKINSSMEEHVIKSAEKHVIKPMMKIKTEPILPHTENAERYGARETTRDRLSVALEQRRRAIQSEDSSGDSSHS